MIKKSLTAIVLCCFVLGMTGCYTMNHVVGEGAKGSTVEMERQWYVLWGLVPINKVDSQSMAKGAKDYTITTKQSFLDIVIGLFTGVVTVYPMTVEVKK